MFGIVTDENSDRKDRHDIHAQYGPILLLELKESCIG